MSKLYNIRQEPDGSWTVYDQTDDLPVLLDGIPQIGLSAEDAIKIVYALNEIADERARATVH